jgi:hypothetical protein
MKKGYLLILVFAALISMTVSSLTVYATSGRTNKSLPHTFTAGTTAVASEVNENFDYLQDEIDNIPTGAQLQWTATISCFISYEDYNQCVTNNCPGDMYPIAWSISPSSGGASVGSWGLASVQIDSALGGAVYPYFWSKHTSSFTLNNLKALCAK